MNGREDERRRGAVRAVVAGVVLLAVAVTVVTGWVDWAVVGEWARPQAVLLGFWLLGGLLVAGGGYSWWRASRPRPARRRVRRSPPLSWWAVAAAALVIAGVAWGATSWLLGKAAAAADSAAAQVEAIKTGLGIGAGTAGVFALLLAVRRQWHQEITATDTTFDATERRVTELYTKAAEQLGSDKAPVRLAGLYALERLAQDHVEQRQTIVNVLCAYLRMPFTVPGDPPADDADDKVVELYRERVQEREVRLAAQRILAHHLRPGDDPDHPVETFWADLDLDLTEATLIAFDLRHCVTRDARFNSANFTDTAGFYDLTVAGDVQFSGAKFTGRANFVNVNFDGTTWFIGATFASTTEFYSADFAGDAWFNGATFVDDADFADAVFRGGAQFRDVTFASDASFSQAVFGDARFIDATFTGDATFSDAIFTGSADFQEATFIGATVFSRVTLPSAAYVDEKTPWPWTDFTNARFERGVPLEVEQFVRPPQSRT